MQPFVTSASAPFMIPALHNLLAQYSWLDASSISVVKFYNYIYSVSTIFCVLSQKHYAFNVLHVSTWLPSPQQPFFSTYLIKFVCSLTCSGSGLSIPDLSPYSISLSIQAIFFPSTLITCIPSLSCMTSSGVYPWTIFQ